MYGYGASPVGSGTSPSPGSINGPGNGPELPPGGMNYPGMPVAYYMPAPPPVYFAPPPILGDPNAMYSLPPLPPTATRQWLA
jgi:hypothetical protein